MVSLPASRTKWGEQHVRVWSTRCPAASAAAFERRLNHPAPPCEPTWLARFTITI